MKEIKPITKMTFETLGSTFTIEHSEDCFDIYELLDSTIRPLLLAAGYQPGTLDDVFGPGN